MDISIRPKENQTPCVTWDEGYDRYMLNKAEKRGEFFYTAEQLLKWVQEYWDEKDFCQPEEYYYLMKEIQKMI